MQNTIRQSILFAIVMLGLGPMAGWIAGGMRLSDGGAGGLIFGGSGGAGDMLGAVLIVALSTVAAALGAILRGPRHALFAAGLTLAWAAWATPGVDELFRRTRDGRVLLWLVGDAVLLSLLVLIGVFAAVRFSKPVGHREHDIGASAKAMLMDIASPARLGGLLAMIIAGVLGGTIIARSPLDGQTFAAGVAAGLAGAALGRIIAYPMTLGPLLIGGAIIAIIAPMWGVIAAGTGENAVGAALAGAMPGLAWLKPWSALGGVLVGIPLGASWAEEIAAKQQHRHADPTAKRPGGSTMKIKRAASAASPSGGS